MSDRILNAAKRKTRKKREPEADALLLQSIVESLMNGYGHGGLSWMARKLDITPTNLQKRMASVRGAFDAPTLRAALLVLAHKEDKFETEPAEQSEHGNFTIGIHETEEGRTPSWKKK